MHFWMVLILFSCLLLNVNSRPQQSEYNNDSDNDETEDDETDSEAELYSSDDSGLNDQDSAVQEDSLPRNRRLMDLSENRQLQHGPLDDNLGQAKSEPLKDTRHDQGRFESLDLIDFTEHAKFYPKPRQLNKYFGKKHDQQGKQLANHDVSKAEYIQNDNQMNKRTVGFANSANEEDRVLFENNQDLINSNNKIEYNLNEASDSEQQHKYKPRYSKMETENREIDDIKTRDGARFNMRDRREVAVLSESEKKETNEKQANEDDEAAIKRHIKNLSTGELDQLMNSLSEEKKELLKKIMDDSDSNSSAYINKRDITKKAGAVAEEINYIENCQSDLNKLQGDNPSLETNSESALSQNSESSQSSSQQLDSKTDNPDMSQKTTVGEVTSLGNVELNNRNSDAKSIPKESGSSLETFSFDKDKKKENNLVNEQVTAKIDTKREANFEDLNDSDFVGDNKFSQQMYVNGYLNDSDESLTDVLIDDAKEDCGDKTYKREISHEKESELSDSLKSLEDSFPRSNGYDDSAPYTGPLVRVKRKVYEPVVHKRSLGLMPDAKVSYFPHKIGIEDEDNDEGNEFDDESFYDRTSNFANSNGVINNAALKSENSLQLNDNSKSSNKNFDGDAMSLGSDTDSVLSGVEGVDDNLMYNSNSGTRNKRDPEDNSIETTQSKTDDSKSRPDDSRSVSESYENIPYYQENDAFGPLPRNYDGDLSRYKRIRRVKELRGAQ